MRTGPAMATGAVDAAAAAPAAAPRSAGVGRRIVVALCALEKKVPPPPQQQQPQQRQQQQQQRRRRRWWRWRERLRRPLRRAQTQSTPMQLILDRLRRSNDFDVIVFTNECGCCCCCCCAPTPPRPLRPAERLSGAGRTAAHAAPYGTSHPNSGRSATALCPSTRPASHWPRRRRARAHAMADRSAKHAERVACAGVRGAPASVLPERY